MKNAIAAVLTGCVVVFSGGAYAAGDTGSDTGGDTGSANTAAGVPQAMDTTHGMSHGVVKKVDTAAGKLTIKHGPLENLGMGAMTMVFKVGDPAMLSQVKVGDQIDFVADEVNGALTVTKLQKR